MAKTALEKAQATLGALTLEELKVLQETVNWLIGVKEGSTTSVPSPSTNGHVNGNGNGAHAGGHLELKMINGCGPYAYRRTVVYEGGKRKLKSEYIGKVGKT